MLGTFREDSTCGCPDAGAAIGFDLLARTVERGDTCRPALGGPSRACDRCDGGSRNGPRVGGRPRGRGDAEWLHTG